jgi:hypothetical protein
VANRNGVTKPPREQARLVKTAVSKSTFDRGRLSPTYPARPTASLETDAMLPQRECDDQDQTCGTDELKHGRYGQALDEVRNGIRKESTDAGTKAIDVFSNVEFIASAGVCTPANRHRRRACGCN